MEKQMFCSQEGDVLESTFSQCVFDATVLTLVFEHCFVVMGPFHMTAFPGNKTLTRPRARCQWLQRCGELPIRHKVRWVTHIVSLYENSNTDSDNIDLLTNVAFDLGIG